MYFFVVVKVAFIFALDRQWSSHDSSIIKTKLFLWKSVYMYMQLLIHFKWEFLKDYVIKFANDLREVCGFLRFPPPIKQTATI